MTGSAYVVLLLVAIVLGAPFIVYYFVGFVPTRQEEVLETSGIDIYGRVVDLQPAGGWGRGYHSASVDYIYAPAELAGTPGRIARGESYIPEQDYETLRVGNVVLLVYEPHHPEHVALKGAVEGRRLGKKPHPGLILALLLMPYGLLSSPLLYMPFLFWREKRLLQWGHAAAATIIAESDYTDRGGSKSILTYTFQDEHGARWTGGTTVSAGQREDPRPNLDLIGPPTVVYDPGNSEKHMLYPGSTWLLGE